VQNGNPALYRGMTSETFRQLALAQPGAEEHAHMNHPDFRAGGKIFASLGYPDAAHGMVRLTPEQQTAFMEKAPHTFSPCAGVWGARGATAVHLPSATKSVVQQALAAAIQQSVRGGVL
jgi:hypothetical protein